MNQNLYVTKQLSTLALACVQPGSLALLRTFVWHNTAVRLGIYLPLFVVHDLGLILSAKEGLPDAALGLPQDFPEGSALADLRGLLSRYLDLLLEVKRAAHGERLLGHRLSDELLGVLIARILMDVYQRYPQPHRQVFPAEIPLACQLAPPAVFNYADLPLSARDFLEFLVTPPQPLLVHIRAGQIDTDTVRLLSLFSGTTTGAQLGTCEPGFTPIKLDLLDLWQSFQSPDASGVASFSMDLLPSIEKGRHATSTQLFSAEGYATIERRGSPDSLVASELAYDEDLFLLKMLEGDLFYYGHEKQRETAHRLHYILIDASPSMRGLRQVFCRGLALSLARRLSVSAEDDVWLRFFDARLSDIVRLSRQRAEHAVPALLSYSSERGRNYGRVFRQLLAELSQIKRSSQIILYILTHGHCHIPLEIVSALRREAILYGVFLLPSSEIDIDYLDLLHRHQIVREGVLGKQTERRKRALEIVEDAARQTGASP